MKNKFITLLFVVILNLNPLNLTFADEFIFEVGNLEITNNGKVYKGNNRGKVTTDNQTEIISDNFEYLKKTNQLEANGDVILTDIENNIIINAEKIFYLKNEEKIYTVGKTLIKVSNEYNIEGSDLTLLKDKMILSSDKITTISDNFSNLYRLKRFEYSINEEILKGEKIEVTTNYKKNKSDKYFFETGFINLKENHRLDELEYSGVKGFPVVAKVIAGQENILRFYDGYGDELGRKQESINKFGNAFLKENYPKVDYILKAYILEN